MLSLPSRGAWIEIVWTDCQHGEVYSRSPRGERGLKLATNKLDIRHYHVAPLAGSVD